MTSTGRNNHRDLSSLHWAERTLRSSFMSSMMMVEVKDILCTVFFSVN